MLSLTDGYPYEVSWWSFGTHDCLFKCIVGVVVRRHRHGVHQWILLRKLQHFFLLLIQDNPEFDPLGVDLESTLLARHSSL
jgi:hypothetical protein